MIWFSPDSYASDSTSRMTGAGEAADSAYSASIMGVAPI